MAVDVSPEPRFAVIVPAWNAAGTLARALDSALAQTWPAHEIIVVDDGSTDGTVEVAARYGQRIRLISQTNSGVSAARNAGAAVAVAEWLCFLDADDWYYPERLATYAAFIRDDGRLDFLTGDFDYVDVDGMHLRRSMESTSAGRALLATVRDGRAVMEGALLGEFIAAHFGDTHTLTVPRTSFHALGGYPTGFTVCEDVNFLIRLCARSRRVGVVCTPLAAYCIHERSATRSDPLRAQHQTVAALQQLEPQLRGAPAHVRHGLAQAIAHARYDLASCLLRAGQRGAALRAVFPLLAHGKVWALRSVLSVAKAALGA